MSKPADSAPAVFQPRRVLVVVKQTLKAQAEASDDEKLKKVLSPDNEERARIEATDREHNLTLQHVVSVLSDRDITARCLAREPGENFDAGDADMIVTVGGDGTFLDASHSVLNDVPLLGVNSAPASSHGHFCVTNRGGFEGVLDAILAGRRKPFSLLRLQLAIDGEPVDVPVLNEVAFAHPLWAGTARYKIEVDGETAEHKASGIIVSTPSGSTGFMRSAKGPIADITDTAFAWWVDKPFKTPGVPFPLRGGEVLDGKLTITSQMVEGLLFLDGLHIRREVERGARITFSVHPNPIRAFVDADCHDRYKADEWV